MRVTLREYAERLGRPYGTVNGWCLDGSFEAKTGHRPVKIGQRWYVEVPASLAGPAAAVASGRGVPDEGQVTISITCPPRRIVATLRALLAQLEGARWP